MSEEAESSYSSLQGVLDRIEVSLLVSLSRGKDVPARAPTTSSVMEHIEQISIGFTARDWRLLAYDLGMDTMDEPHAMAVQLQLKKHFLEARPRMAEQLTESSQLRASHLVSSPALRSELDQLKAELPCA